MDKHSLSFKEQMAKSITQVETTKFVQVSLDQGQHMVKHKTPHHLNLILLSGQIRFTLEGEELLLEASDMITVEPGREHALEALEKSVALLVLVPVSKEEVAPKLQEPKLDHENAFMNPGLVDNIAQELRPLVEDHIELCRVLDTAKGPFEKEKVSAILEAVGVELDNHFVVEEELLFPRMAKHVGGFDVGPVARLLEEHKKIRGLHGEANQLLTVLLEQGDAHVKTLLHEKVKELAHALLNHLGKEDSHLFPMASRLLTAEELRAVAEGLAQYQ